MDRKESTLVASRAAHRPAWVNDAECKNCPDCQKPFTLMKRKHHCRSCGKVYCDKCANHFVPLRHMGYYSPTRICTTCCRQLVTQSQSARQLIQPVELDDSTETGFRGLPSQWEKAFKEENLTKRESTSHPDEILELLQLKYPLDDKPEEALPKWKDVQPSIQAANFLRTENPQVMFQGMQKIAEGGQGVVYRAMWKLDEPSLLQRKASFVQPDGSGVTPRPRLATLVEGLTSSRDVSATFFTPSTSSGSSPRVRDVAIKRIKLAFVKSLDFVRNEVALTKMSRHPNIINYFDTFVCEGELWMVMEYMHGGALSLLLEKSKRLSERETAYICRETFNALRFLHGRHRMHRDIKSDNVLLGMGGEVKLSDFGFAVQLTQECDTRKSVIGTPYWMAPEVIRGSTYGTEADVWSVGIMAIECIDGLPPHMHESPLKAMLLISTRPPPRPINKFSATMESFLSCCLALNPSERWSAERLLDHPFIATACDPSIFSQTIVRYHKNAVVPIPNKT